ncbi:hypothetical protein [Tsukamurella soli]|uniref:hypothetical protein n=1 Tax=Tsukamurella soli TaxID=644556 RepID=UPI0036146BCF
MAWTNTIAQRFSRPITVLTLGDSRANGWRNTPDVGVTDRNQLFGDRVAQLLRAHLGLPTGGRGWIPMSLDGYSVDGTGGCDYPLPTQDGNVVVPDWAESWANVPGAHSLLLDDDPIRIPIGAGCTSVEFYGVNTNPGGWTVTMTGESTGTATVTNADSPYINISSGSLAAPGSWVELQCTTLPTGNDCVALGCIEYAGDEDFGIRPLTWGWPESPPYPPRAGSATPSTASSTTHSAVWTW